MVRKAFSRADQSTLGTWWWTIDHWLLGSAIILLILGALLGLSASPMVACRLGLDYFFFVKRHLMVLIPALLVMLTISLTSIRQMRYIAWVVFFFSLAFMLLTPFMGSEIKGAKRWVSLFGFSLQASEFIKPSFAIVAAWLFSKNALGYKSKNWGISAFFFALILVLLLLQPDFGMTFVVSLIWLTQLFIAGLPFRWVTILIGLGFIGVVAAYFTFSHVAQRIDNFLSGGETEKFQVTQSLEGLRAGGLVGVGPGEGVVKRHLPDAHADFIFSVAGEEFGYILCIVIIILYLFIICRSFYHIYKSGNLFIVLALVGIIMQYALQAFINIASTVNLIPTKGMTLPFLSYGGSSLLGVSLGMGMLLCLTRKTD